MSIEALTTEISGKTYLSPEQRSSLRREINQLEWAINGKSMMDGADTGGIRVGGHAPEPELARENQARLETMLHEGTPPETSDVEKNYLYREMKGLEAKIQDGMPTDKQMREASAANVDHHIAWEHHNISNILKWKQIRRILDPENDQGSFLNIEVLRPIHKDGYTPVNTEKFRAGYDLIHWETKIEEEIADVIDDAVYLKFLELHARDWSRKSVIRELGIDGRMYEMMMERFQSATPVPPEDFEDEEAGSDLVVNEPQEENWLFLELQEVGVSKSTLQRDCGVNWQVIKRALEGEEINQSSLAKIKKQLKSYRISKARKEGIAAKKEAEETLVIAHSENLVVEPQE